MNSLPCSGLIRFQSTQTAVRHTPLFSPTGQMNFAVLMTCGLWKGTKNNHSPYFSLICSFVCEVRDFVSCNHWINWFYRQRTMAARPKVGFVKAVNRICCWPINTRRVLFSGRCLFLISKSTDLIQTFWDWIRLGLADCLHTLRLNIMLRSEVVVGGGGEEGRKGRWKNLLS